MENQKRNLSPSLVLRYLKCPKMMHTSARANTTQEPLSLYQQIVDNKLIQRYIAKRWLNNNGYNDIRVGERVSAHGYSAKVDFLAEKDNTLHIFHLVAKIFTDESDLLTKKGAPNFESRDYFVRAAVCQKTLCAKNPDKPVESHFLMLKGSSLTEVPSIELYNAGNGLWGINGEPSEEAIDLIVEFPVTEICKQFLNGDIQLPNNQLLGSIMCEASQVLNQDSSPAAAITHRCGTCAYKDNCIHAQYPEAEAGKTIFDINSLNYKKKNQLLSSGIIKMTDVPNEELTERQRIQVENTIANESNPWYFADGIYETFRDLKFPLHCIDFETAIFPIPPYKDTRCMDGVIYQYSHHQLENSFNGPDFITRHSEYINLEKAANPTIGLIRALRKDLSGDNGTVVIYSQHENTYLLFAYEQILNSNAPDKEELLSFLRSITTPTEEMLKKIGEQPWEPTRPMFDLLDFVKETFYHKRMAGSNSIKSVLPAMLESIPELQNYWKYGYNGTNMRAQPIVNADKSGRAISPYDMLPQVPGIELKKGDQALQLYTELLFTNIPDEKRDTVKKAMLTYCEMDTLAEVILLQGLYFLEHRFSREMSPMY